MVVDGEVLALFEGLEAVDDDLVDRRGVLHHPDVEQGAVSGEARDMTIDRVGADAEVAGDLAVGHAADGLS